MPHAVDGRSHSYSEHFGLERDRSFRIGGALRAGCTRSDACLIQADPIAQLKGRQVQVHNILHISTMLTVVQYSAPNPDSYCKLFKRETRPHPVPPDER